MVRIASILLFSTVILMATDCQAQRFRLFQRSQSNAHAPRHSHSRSTAKPKTHRSPLHWLLEDHQSAESRAWSNYYANPASPLPKYIGGFHSSHFYNLGVPNGDIGFRGNGIYWAPW